MSKYACFGGPMCKRMESPTLKLDLRQIQGDRGDTHLTLFSHCNNKKELTDYGLSGRKNFYEGSQTVYL